MRRAGSLLIASAITFVVALLFLFIVGADYYDDLTTAADAVGGSIADVSEVERARIAGDHATFFVFSVVLFVIPHVALALGLRDIDRTLRSTDDMTGKLTRAAWWGGAACMIFWVCAEVLLLGLLAGPDDLPPLVRDLNTFTPLITVAAIVGSVAVGCAAWASRRARIASRMALAVVILVGLVVLGTLVETLATGELAEVPEFLPMIPALLLGIGLLRARRASAVS
jgi:hypothetical protein